MVKFFLDNLSTDSTVRERSQTYFVGAEGDASSTARTELGLAIRTDVAAAIGKLGFVADPTGGRVSLLLRVLLSLLSDLLHLVLVHLKLLVQLPVEGREGHLVFSCSCRCEELELIMDQSEFVL